IIVAFCIAILITTTLLGIRAALVTVVLGMVMLNLANVAHLDENTNWHLTLSSIGSNIYLAVGLFVLVGFSWFATQELARLVHNERQLSEQLRTYNDQLEQQVQERTAELQQQTEALQTSEELYRTLIRNFPNGVVFL